MSVVSTVIVSWDDVDPTDDLAQHLDVFVERWKGYSGAEFRRIDDRPDFSGGNKTIPPALFVAAFSHFPIDDFLAHLRNFAWPTWSGDASVVTEQVFAPSDPIPYTEHRRPETGFSNEPDWPLVRPRAGQPRVFRLSRET